MRGEGGEGGEEGDTADLLWGAESWFPICWWSLGAVLRRHVSWGPPKRDPVTRLSLALNVQYFSIRVPFGFSDHTFTCFRLLFWGTLRNLGLLAESQECVAWAGDMEAKR